MSKVSARGAGFWPLEQFAQGRWGRLLAYPSGESAAIAQRLTWLQAQGVSAIHRHGPKPIEGWSTLGLGYRGLVLLAQYRGRPVALKLRRTNAPDVDLRAEAASLVAANQVGVGPRLLAAQEDCLLMDYCPGPGLLQWLEQVAPDQARVWGLLSQLLDQAFALDQIGLDHGDLRCVTEHVRVQGDASGPLHSDRPRLIDFGSASRDRRPANLTTLTQGLFIGTAIAAYLQHRFEGSALACATGPRRTALIDCLRQYKSHPGSNAHRVLLNFLKP